MLLERAAGVAAKIQHHQRLKSAIREAEQFETRARQLEEAAKALVEIREELRAFAAVGIEINFVPKDAAGYASKAATLRNCFADDPTKVSDLPFHLKHDFLDRLKGIAKAARERMAGAWQEHAHGKIEGRSDEVLDALGRVPQFRDCVARIKRVRADITTLGGELPRDLPDALGRLDKLVAEQRTAWSELSADDIPHNVMRFIRLSTEEGAPLSIYTDDVQVWLENRKIDKAFRIRLC